MQITLNCHSPLDPAKPFPKQWEFLQLDCSGSSKTRNHYVGGRGSSKTTTGILKAFLAATKWHNGKAGLWTEPTYKLCKDVFLREWQRIVPRDCYTINRSDMVITMCEALGGGTIDIRSRNVDNPSKEMSKGPNYAWAINDEAAYKFNPDVAMDIDAAVRDGSNYLFNDFLTTPKLNDYFDFCHQDGHRLVKASSFDNPHLPDGWAEQMREQLGEKRFAQEIMGDWVALEGLIWDAWSDELWPNGNRINYAHNHKRPYYLFFDLGVASSAWVIVQPLGQEYFGLGRAPFPHGDPLWVVTAEFMPDRDGNASRMLQKIKDEFGKPAHVCCGHDLTRRSDADGSTPEYFLAQIMGSVPVTPIGSDAFLSDKVIQQDALAYLIHNTKQQRRFAVSTKLISENKKKRGVLEMMTQDTWDSSPKTANYLPKDGRLEHVRDALLYGAVGTMKPPSYAHKTAYAA
jgi:hypothetical protein